MYRNRFGARNTGSTSAATGGESGSAATRSVRRAAQQDLVRDVRSPHPLRRIRAWLIVFIVGLALSGATAIPLQPELNQLVGLAQRVGISGAALHCLMTVQNAVCTTNGAYPFMAYGTDWLAFGHFAIALAFVGCYRDPLRNRWLITFGLLCCALVIPYALVFGAVRGIPYGWRLLDCSFGIGGAIPLWFCELYIRRINRAPEAPSPGDAAPLIVDAT